MYIELELMKGLFGPVIDTNAHATVIHRGVHTYTHTACGYTVHTYTYVLNKRLTCKIKSQQLYDILTSRVGTLPVDCPWTGMHVLVAPQLEVPAEK